MEEKLKKIFLQAKLEENPDLAENVWQNIILLNKRVIYLRLWIFSSVGIASLIGLIPAWRALSSDLSQSGLYEYFSVAFSSGSPFFSYGKELALSIAESLPIMSIILSLSLVFIFFLSLKYTAKQIIRNSLILSI